MEQYSAEVRHDGQFWSIYVPELDRHTQAEDEGAIEGNARNLIATLQGIDEASFSLDIQRPVRQEVER